ncbi:MAG: cell surface protein [Lentisphaeria bacterium]|jgi:YVTN family beta-propeller protein
MMNTLRRYGVVGAWLVAMAAWAAPAYLSPVALVPSQDGNTLYVAEDSGKQIAVVDCQTRKVTKVYNLSGRVRSLALSADGATLACAVGGADGRVALLALPGGKVREVAVGHTPQALVFSSDGSRVYVCNRFSSDLFVIDVAKAKAIQRVPCGREPHALALAADGSKLFALNHMPIGAANGDYNAIQVEVFSLPELKALPSILLPNGAIVGRGACASPDGRYVYLTHGLARYQLPTTQLERGWMNTNAVSVIDVNAHAVFNTFLLDDVELGAANPWGISCSPDGKSLAVVSAGSQELSVIDREALHNRLERAARNEKVTSVTAEAAMVPNDLSFLVDIRQRYALPGKGPRAVAVVQGRFWVTEYFSDCLAVVDPAAPAPERVQSIPLGPALPMTAERRGEMLFNSGDICFQQWQSCGSCHPDGRTDGINWDLLNDGMGNPKQSKSLLYSHVTPPTMISGIRKNAEACVAAGIRYIQFAIRPPEDAEAIDAYCRAMKHEPSPFLKKGKLSQAARRGEKVFVQAGCAECHPKDRLFTDCRQYDLGMQDEMDKGKAWDTPTLIEVWRTAPYLFDGRSKTIRELLTIHNPGDVHGQTSKLSEQELADLEAYILSL